MLLSQSVREACNHETIIVDHNEFETLKNNLKKVNEKRTQK